MYEEELALIASMLRQPAQVRPRVAYLVDKLATSQVKVEEWETEMEDGRVEEGVEY